MFSSPASGNIEMLVVYPWWSENNRNVVAVVVVVEGKQ